MIYPKEGEEGYQPRLAERWEMSADGLTWDLYLRQGIQFHEGWGEFTAEDVLFTFQMAGGPSSTVGVASYFRIGDGGSIESYEIVGPYHFRMKLVEPNLQMEYLLSVTDWTGIASKKYFDVVGYDNAILHPIGTGPWRFVESKPAEYVKFEAVENHWRQTPEFKYLTIKGVPELSTRLAMLKTGVADFTEVPMDKVAELEDAELHFKNRAGVGHSGVVLGGMVLPTREGYDPTVPWVPHQDEEMAFADHAAGWGKLKPGGSEWNQRALKVRMAMQYAINWAAIIDNIFYGEAEKAPLSSGDGWAPFGSVFTRPEWEPFPYDPELSIQLLEEAGYPDGFELRYLIYASEQQPRNEEISEAVARDFEAIGLTVNRERTEETLYGPMFRLRESAWVARLDAYGPEFEPWAAVDFTNHSENAAYNDGYESLELDKLIDRAGQTLDFNDRVAVNLEMGDWLCPQYVTLTGVLTNRVFALSQKIGNLPVGVAPWPYRWNWFEYATQAD